MPVKKKMHTEAGRNIEQEGRRRSRLKSSPQLTGMAWSCAKKLGQKQAKHFARITQDSRRLNISTGEPQVGT